MFLFFTCITVIHIIYLWFKFFIIYASLTGPRRGSQKETEIYQREKPGKEKQKDTKTQI